MVKVGQIVIKKQTNCESVLMAKVLIIRKTKVFPSYKKKQVKFCKIYQIF